MKVQLLYFPDCPNLDAARAALREAFSRADVADTYEEIDVTDSATPEHLREWGSPTILIDDSDVGGDRKPRGPSCRLYESNSGVPSVDRIVSALQRAQQQEGHHGKH